MSALLDELHSVLSSYRDEIGTWVNQGLGVSVEGHLRQLEAAASATEQDAKAAVHQVLTDLYTAFHAPAPEIPAPAAPAEAPAPPLATGGTVAGPGPVVAAEPGPEAVAAPPAAAADAAPAAAEPTSMGAPAAETATAEGPAEPAATPGS